MSDKYPFKCPGCGYETDQQDEIEDNGLCAVCNGAEDYPANDGGIDGSF